MHRPFFIAGWILALATLAGGCGASRDTSAAVDRTLARVNSPNLAPTAGETARIQAAAARARGGLIDRFFGKRAAAAVYGPEETPRDRFIRLKADQTVFIRRGGTGDGFYQANGITPDEMRALEDEYWLDPDVRKAVLDRTGRRLNENRRPLR